MSVHEASPVWDAAGLRGQLWFEDWLDERNVPSTDPERSDPERVAEWRARLAEIEGTLSDEDRAMLRAAIPLASDSAPKLRPVEEVDVCIQVVEDARMRRARRYGYLDPREEGVFAALSWVLGEDADLRAGDEIEEDEAEPTGGEDW